MLSFVLTVDCIGYQNPFEWRAVQQMLGNQQSRRCFLGLMGTKRNSHYWSTCVD